MPGCAPRLRELWSARSRRLDLVPSVRQQRPNVVRLPVTPAMSRHLSIRRRVVAALLRPRLWSTSRRLWGCVAAGLGLLALGACSSTEPPPPAPDCPATLLLAGAERTTAYRPGAEARASDIRYLAALFDLTSACRYYTGEDGTWVDVDLAFSLVAERGPAMSGDEEVRYFVQAVGPDGRTIPGAQWMLSGDLGFEDGQERVGWSEELTLRLPSVTSDSGAGYTLYVGFPLDEADLARRRQSPVP